MPHILHDSVRTSADEDAVVALDEDAGPPARLSINANGDGNGDANGDGAIGDPCMEQRTPKRRLLSILTRVCATATRGEHSFRLRLGVGRGMLIRLQGE